MKYSKDVYINDAVGVWYGVREFGIDKKTLEQTFEILDKETFIEFLFNLKVLLFSENFFNFIGVTGNDIWDLWVYLSFLVQEDLVKVKGKRLIPKDERLVKNLLRPKSRKEIVNSLEKKLKINLAKKENLPFLKLLNIDFKWKSKFDQVPIYTYSVIFVIEKILEWLPIKGKFLIIGDDDFISIPLSIVEPELEVKVVDIDEDVLEVIEDLNLKLNLSIKTKLVDIRKDKLKEKFFGFYTNPPYTEWGVKKFVSFGVNSFGKDGGMAFLVVGDDVSSRFLFLQKFFSRKGLALWEIVTNKVMYPFVEIDKEYRMIKEKLSSLIDEKLIRKNPSIGANFLVFNYIPWKVKRIKTPRNIYCYV